MSPMLLHLATTLFQTLFSVLQEAEFLNVRRIPWRLMCRFFLILIIRKKIAVLINQKTFQGCPLKIMYFWIKK